ncbi:MAG TPA: hypothetical protein PLB40_14015, partial [Accumulibacter sp.]|nr:hypothetical protein [Accumulibacter sp.]
FADTGLVGDPRQNFWCFHDLAPESLAMQSTVTSRPKPYEISRVAMQHHYKQSPSRKLGFSSNRFSQAIG